MTFSPPPLIYSGKQAQQQPFLTSPLSSEASSSLSSLESTVKSQGSSSSLLAKMAYPERQSWLDIVNISSTTEEVDQPLSFCVQIHAADHPMVDCNDMAESQLLKSNTGSRNSLLSEDTTSSESSRDRLPVPQDLIGMRTLSKGEHIREASLCRTIQYEFCIFLSSFSFFSEKLASGV